MFLNSRTVLHFLSLKSDFFFIALSTDGVSLIITFAAIHVSQGITYFLRPGSGCLLYTFGYHSLGCVVKKKDVAFCIHVRENVC